MYHHSQFTVICSTCSLGNMSYLHNFVLCDCLDCLDKATALARSFLSLTQSCALTLSAAETKPRKSVAIIWQSFVVMWINCKGTFPSCRGTLLSNLLAQICVLCSSFDLQTLYCKWVLKELWYVVGILLHAGNPNFSESFSLWHLWCFGNTQCQIFGITGARIKRKPQDFCIAVGSSWDQWSLNKKVWLMVGPCYHTSRETCTLMAFNKWGSVSIPLARKAWVRENLWW